MLSHRLAKNKLQNNLSNYTHTVVLVLLNYLIFYGCPPPPVFAGCILFAPQKVFAPSMLYLYVIIYYVMARALLGGGGGGGTWHDVLGGQKWEKIPIIYLCNCLSLSKYCNCIKKLLFWITVLVIKKTGRILSWT